MALIKHNQAVDIARSAVVLDLGDLRRQGLLILEAARDQAAGIIAEAKAERERIVAGAAEAGRAAGMAEGREEGLIAGKLEARDAALAEIRPRLEKIEASWKAELEALEQAREGMIHAAERDLVRLALLIAERVVKRQILADPAVVLDQLRAVLSAVARPTALAVRVHPDDVPLLEQAMPTLAARFGAARHAELMADPTLDRGSCVAEMRGAHGPAGEDAPSIAGGEIDASIATQLQRIAEALLPGAAVMEDRTPDDRT